MSLLFCILDTSAKYESNYFNSLWGHCEAYIHTFLKNAVPEISKDFRKISTLQFISHKVETFVDMLPSRITDGSCKLKKRFQISGNKRIAENKRMDIKNSNRKLNHPFSKTCTRPNSPSFCKINLGILKRFGNVNYLKNFSGQNKQNVSLIRFRT